MKKILYVSNTANFSKFNLPLMSWCEQKGWQVDYCAPDDEIIEKCHRHIVLPIPRNPLSLKTFGCIRKLSKILKDENYDIIHCHTPMGSVVARLAAKKMFLQHKVKVIYTAHGFHFFKGAPLLNWLIFYPIEKFLSRYTSTLLTINQEDFDLAKKKFHTKEILKFNGVGVDLSKFNPFEGSSEERSLAVKCGRKNLDLPEDSFMILYVAEFIPRKNHELIFELLPSILKEIPNFHLVLAGKGKLLDHYKKLAEEKDFSDRITFTGYTRNVADYCRVSDILLMPSFQEGLPISMIEAMATGIPIVASRIRGHVDVVEDGKNGFLCDLDHPEQFLQGIKKIYDSPELRDNIFSYNLEKVRQFSLEEIIEPMCRIYEN